VAALVVLAGCGNAASTPEAAAPWEEPVDGTVAVTDWEDRGQPTTPFGPGGYPWGSPEELVAAMAQALATNDGVRTSARVVERHESGTVIGWVRMELGEVIRREGLDEAAVAADMRVEMRNHGGDWWFVVRTESREYCTRELVDGECR
jgi:hypothetical protein